MHKSFGVSPFASPSFFHFTFVNVSNFYFVCSTLQSSLYKNICSISISFSRTIEQYVLLYKLRIRRSKIGNRLKSWTLISMGCHTDPAYALVGPSRSAPTYQVLECCHCITFQVWTWGRRSELIPAGAIDFFER